MEEDVHEYHGEDIAVSYDHERCIHVRACVEGLPAVFDTDHRPWVRLDGSDADDVAAVIERCPTGALHYERRDGGPAEAVPDTNTVTAVADGPLYLRGDVEIRTPDDDLVLHDTRVALCRCGHTANRPLCDNSHARVFEAAGVAPADAPVVAPLGDAASGTGGEATGGERVVTDERPDGRSGEGSDGRLTVTPTRNGPLDLDGPFDLRRGDGEPSSYDGATLCRCGGSSNKPFCDDTHVEIGFTTGDGN
jgi:CDGSH-type Zn-finger protein/uncharacterized Fe-S cluster protein YjdI